MMMWAEKKYSTNVEPLLLIFFFYCSLFYCCFEKRLSNFLFYLGHDLCVLCDTKKKKSRFFSWRDILIVDIEKQN